MQLEGNDLYSGDIPLPHKKASAETKKVTYVIKAGDTLGKIAQKILGDSRKYMAIATMNNITNPHLIYAGTILTILTGEYSGIDINYEITAADRDGQSWSSGSRFKSILE